MIIAFWPREKGQWYITGKFGHVSILEYTNDTWVEINLKWASFTVTPFYTTNQKRELIAEKLKHCTLVQWDKQDRPSGVLRPLTCVTLARQYAGVPSRALLPDRLLRDLLRNGGEILNAAQGTQNPGP